MWKVREKGVGETWGISLGRGFSELLCVLTVHVLWCAVCKSICTPACLVLVGNQEGRKSNAEVGLSSAPELTQWPGFLVAARDSEPPPPPPHSLRLRRSDGWLQAKFKTEVSA